MTDTTRVLGAASDVAAYLHEPVAVLHEAPIFGVLGATFVYPPATCDWGQS